MAERLEFPFSRGVDEGVDPKGASPGTPLAMTNCYQDKLGRVVKRWGLSALTTNLVGAGTITAGQRIVTRGDDLAIFDGANLYTYSDTVNEWQAVDRPSPLTSRKRPLVDTTRSVRMVDIAAAGNLLVTVFEAGTTSPGIYYEVRRLDTNEVITPATYIASGVCPRVLVNVAGTACYIFHGPPSASSNLKAYTLTLASLTLSAATDIVTDALETQPYDAVVTTVSAADRIYLCYCLDTGANTVQVASFDDTFAAVDSITLTGTSDGRVCIDADGTYVHVGFDYAGTTRIWTGDDALVTVTGPTVIDASDRPNLGMFIVAHSATEILFGYATDSDALDAPRMRTNLWTVAAHASYNSGEASRTSYDLEFPSKPWKVNDRYYFAAVTRPKNYDTSSALAVPNASVVVVEAELVDTLTGVSTGNHPHVGTLETQVGYFPQSLMTLKAALVGEVAYVPAAYRNSEPPNANTLVATGFNLHTVTVEDAAWGQTALLGKACLGASSAPFWWDGSSAKPYGFTHAPCIVTVSASSGGSQDAGTYGYQLVYMWRDANGVLHRSPVSPAVSGTTATTNLTLTVVSTVTSVSSKQGAKFGTDAPSPVWIMPYRTTIGGAVYYQLAVEPSYNVLFNDPQTEDVSLADGKDDATITSGAAVALSSQPQVYTSTGEVDDISPPAAIALLGHRGRAWLLADDGRTLWATKSIVDDPTVAPGFNEALTTYFATEKVALGALDESVVVFGPNTVDIVSGEGPDASGNGTWAVRGVQSDRGCINPRSIATIPQGCVFQSDLGIELLTRGLTVEWIGESVRDQLAAYPTVTSAVVVPKARQLRISCVNTGATDGIVLVFDYGRGTWSVFDYGFAVVDAAMVGGVYTVLRGNGTVYRESSTSHRDGTSFVSMSADLSLHGGKQSWMRLKHVQLEATNATPYKLTMSIKRDYADEFEYEKTYPANSDVTDPDERGVARITPPVQKGQAFVLRIADGAPDSDDTADAGTGATWEAISVWVQRKEGLPRVGAGRRG